MAKGALITEAMVIGIFEQIKMNEEITNAELARIWMRPEDTIAKLRRTGSLEGWKAEKKRKAEMERRRAEERKKRAEEQPTEQKPEPQIEGQIRMDLEPKAEETEPLWETPAELQTKMMRFQAAQMDKLIMKIDKLNDTMSMILRVIRRE